MMTTLTQIGIALVSIGILIAWHEFGHYLLARLTGMRVLRYAIGFGPRLLGFRKSGIDYQLGILPFGGYVHIAGMTTAEEGALEDPKSFINRPFWAQFSTIFAGPFFNYILAFALFFLVFWGFSPTDQPTYQLNQVAEQSAAAIGGLQKGDVVLSINNTSPASSREFVALIQDGPHLDVKYLRDGETLITRVTPKLGTDGVYRLGVGFVPLSFSFTGAAKEAFDQLWLQSVGILTGLSRALFSQGEGVQFGGIVAITGQLSTAAGEGVKSLLWLLGSLSVVLGLFNLLPIPALDGSRLLIITLEAITRRRLPEKIQMGIQVVGIVFILGLMLLLTVSDVMRLYDSG